MLEFTKLRAWGAGAFLELVGNPYEVLEKRLPDLRVENLTYLWLVG